MEWAGRENGGEGDLWMRGRNPQMPIRASGVWGRVSNIRRFDVDACILYQLHFDGIRDETHRKDELLHKMVN